MTPDGALENERYSPNVVVHMAEVELESGVNDEEIRDLMVAVYTPIA